MKKLAILSILFAVFTSTAAIADTAKPLKDAFEGTTCHDEATLNDMQAAKPLICTDGKWRPVVFKTSEDGTTSPLFYEGKCALRFTEGGTTKGSLSLKSDRLADICFPVGWRIQTVASTDSMSWRYHSSVTMPNVLLLQAIDANRPATIWIYPMTTEGNLAEKLEVQLRSIK